MPCGAPSRLRPAQAGHIALAEPRGQREQDHVALVLVQLIEKCLCLLRRDPAHPTLRLPVELYLRGLVDPFPFVASPAQDRADQGQVTVGGRSAGLRTLARPDFYNHVTCHFC